MRAELMTEQTITSSETNVAFAANVRMLLGMATALVGNHKLMRTEALFALVAGMRKLARVHAKSVTSQTVAP